MAKQTRPDVSYKITIEEFSNGSLTNTVEYYDKDGALLVTFGKLNAEGRALVNKNFIGNLNLDSTAQAVIDAFCDIEEDESGKIALTKAFMNMVNDDIKSKRKNVEAMDRIVEQLSKLPQDKDLSDEEFLDVLEKATKK